MKNREILFRGKRRDNSKWIIGYYLIVDGISYILPEKHFLNGIVWVDPATIGQYTGLTDKNGVKIFEGDIVRILGNQGVEDWKNVNYTALIAFLDGGFCAIDGTVDDHAFRRYVLCRMDFDVEVIGSIYDNPELLK